MPHPGKSHGELHSAGTQKVSDSQMLQASWVEVILPIFPGQCTVGEAFCTTVAWEAWDGVCALVFRLWAIIQQYIAVHGRSARFVAGPSTLILRNFQP